MTEIIVLKPSRRYRKVNCTTFKSKRRDQVVSDINYRSKQFVEKLNELTDERRKSND